MQRTVSLEEPARVEASDILTGTVSILGIDVISLRRDAMVDTAVHSKLDPS